MNKEIALVCASNQNRSMEAHALLVKNGFQRVSSFGTNARVKLPGPSVDEPIVYEFGVTYEEIRKDLESKDREMFAFLSCPRSPPAFKSFTGMSRKD